MPEFSLRFATSHPDVRRRHLIEDAIVLTLAGRGEVVGGGSMVNTGGAFAWQDILIDVAQERDIEELIHELQAALRDMGLPANATFMQENVAIPLYTPRLEALNYAAELVGVVGDDALRPTLDFYRAHDRVPTSSLFTMILHLANGLARELGASSDRPVADVLAEVRRDLASELDDTESTE